MPLTDGDRAEEWDHWTRVITNKKHLKKGKVIHHGAFGGTALGAASAGRGWTHELSGRLRSLSKDIVRESRDFCERRQPPLSFIGVMFAQVGSLRENVGGFDTDVYYTPNADRAHSDLVAFGAPSEFELDIIIDWLKRTIRGAPTDNLRAVVALPVTNSEEPAES
jgi:hypothetical protein